MLSKRIRQANAVARVRTYGAIVALILFLFSLASPVLSVSVEQGGSGELTWSELSPESLSVVVAALAAWGVTLLTKEKSVRVFSGLQAGLGLAALYLWFSQGPSAEEAALEEAERIVGIEGVVSASDLAVSSHPVASALVVGVCVAVVASGVAGVFAPQRVGKRVNRFERDDPKTSSEIWDQLSHGDDPTAR